MKTFNLISDQDLTGICGGDNSFGQNISAVAHDINDNWKAFGLSRNEYILDTGGVKNYGAGVSEFSHTVHGPV